MNKPIRILHMLHSMNRGGAENAIMNYYRHIDREKVQFDFLLTDPNHTSFEDEISLLGGRVFRVPLLTIRHPWPYIKGVWSFLKSHPEYRIVHSHTSSKSVFPLALARILDVPVRCSHSHSSSTEGGFTGIIRNMLMPFLKLTATDYLSCGDQAGIWLYGKKTFDTGQVLVFKNVIEAQKFQLNPIKRKEYRKKLGVGSDTLLLGHTARFSKVKNHLFDLKILRSLHKMGVKSKLLLIGGGELESEIRVKVEEFNLTDDVIFAGVVSNVYDYEQAMDVFLLPSFFEGLPLSIVEAQVSGLPCFATYGTISKECSVTDLVTYIKLEDGPDVWAEKILIGAHQFRHDRYDDIVKGGYDAGTSAKQFEEFYLKRYMDSAI